MNQQFLDYLRVSAQQFSTYLDQVPSGLKTKKVYKDIDAIFSSICKVVVLHGHSIDQFVVEQALAVPPLLTTAAQKALKASKLSAASEASSKAKVLPKNTSDFEKLTACHENTTLPPVKEHLHPTGDAFKGNRLTGAVVDTEEKDTHSIDSPIFLTHPDTVDFCLQNLDCCIEEKEVEGPIGAAVEGPIGAAVEETIGGITICKSQAKVFTLEELASMQSQDALDKNELDKNELDKNELDKNELDNSQDDFQEQKELTALGAIQSCYEQNDMEVNMKTGKRKNWDQEFHSNLLQKFDSMRFTTVFGNVDLQNTQTILKKAKMQ